MPEVLPAVTEHDGDAKPGGGFKDPVDRFGRPDLPGCETIGQSIAEMRMEDRLHEGDGHLRRLGVAQRCGMKLKLTAERCSIDTNQCENPGKSIPAFADTSSPHGHIIIVSPVKVPGIHGPSKVQAQGRLDSLLEEHRAEDLSHGDTVALFKFFRGMKTVLGEVVHSIDVVEQQGHEPVCRYRENERKVEIREPWQQPWDWLQSVGRESSKFCRRVVQHVWELCGGGIGYSRDGSTRVVWGEQGNPGPLSYAFPDQEELVMAGEWEGWEVSPFDMHGKPRDRISSSSPTSSSSAKPSHWLSSEAPDQPQRHGQDQLGAFRTQVASQGCSGR